MFDPGCINFEEGLSPDGCIGSSTSEQRGVFFSKKLGQGVSPVVESTLTQKTQ
jgi:hypothetical protein